MHTLLARRLFASAIDLAIEALPAALTGIPLSIAFASLLPECFVCQGCTAPTCDGIALVLVAVAVAPSILAWMANRIARIHLLGATVGMSAAGLRLVSVEGARPVFRVIVVREAARLLGLACLGAGVLVICADGLGWHDEWSGTRVRRAVA